MFNLLLLFSLYTPKAPELKPFSRSHLTGARLLLTFTQSGDSAEPPPPYDTRFAHSHRRRFSPIALRTPLPFPKTLSRLDLPSHSRHVLDSPQSDVLP